MKGIFTFRCSCERTPGHTNARQDTRTHARTHERTPGDAAHICTHPKHTQRTRVGVARRGVFIAIGAFLLMYNSKISIIYSKIKGYKKGNRNPSDCLYYLFFEYYFL